MYCHLPNEVKQYAKRIAGVRVNDQCYGVKRVIKKRHEPVRAHHFDHLGERAAGLLLHILVMIHHSLAEDCNILLKNRFIVRDPLGELRQGPQSR